MKYMILEVSLVLIIGVVALVALVAAVTGAVQRRRGQDHDGEVIADSQVDLESDAKTPPFEL